jgi:hypothetical protein
VDVVAEKTVGEKVDFFLLTVKRQLFQVSLSVAVVAKDALPVVASADDMVDGSGVLDPDWAGHPEQLLHFPPICNSIHLYKPDPLAFRRWNQATGRNKRG